MVKSYLKYEQASKFGLIASPACNVVWQPEENGGRPASKAAGAGRAFTGAGEEVLCWDVKKGELLSSWKDPNSTAEVTTIASAKTSPEIFAVGYNDGSIRIWDSRLATIVITFNGHKSAVTALAFDKDDVRLASGSKDTDIIIWDLIAETGLYKLRAHKDQLTALQFMYSPTSLPSTYGNTESTSNGNGDINGKATLDEVLVSTSKDALLKLWDTESQHCFETHVAQTNGECWSMSVASDQSGLMTGGNDGEIKVWSIDFKNAVMDSDGDHKEKRSVLSERGVLRRQGKDRTTKIVFHPQGDYIAACGLEKSVEMWRMRTEAEVQKALHRKRRRRREKGRSDENQGDDQPAAEVPLESLDIASADIDDIFVPHVIVRTGGKVSSFDWTSRTGLKKLQMLVSTSNNMLEMWNIDKKAEGRTKTVDEAPEYTRPLAIELPGHRTDVRALALSSDDRMLASASNGALKIWNVKTTSCIRTLECGYALCAAFLPGDKILAVGNRNGELELFDITSSTLIESETVHDGPVWTMDVHPDGRSMATGSADKSAKFFRFEVVQEEVPGSKRVTPRFKLVHTRTLKVSDDVLSLRFSPDTRYIALALLDNTVKVFFLDSLKLFLNLYGHKLPVLDMDISYDSKMIVTCSADKNVRLWGLDFGDCHKAFFAHQDSIIKVAFVTNDQDGNGHHFFSASKDSLIKYWDGDKFEQIQKLSGHHGEVWALAVSRTGDFVVSASHDKSIRVWRQTDEQIFLEEEREKELEDLYEKTLTSSLEREEDNDDDAPEAVAAGNQTAETMMAGERIIEALDLGMEDLELMAEYKKAAAVQSNTAMPARHPIYLANNGVSAEKYLLNTVQRIKAAALQDALLVLPLDKVPPLFIFLRIWAERRWNMPLTCRILFFMLKTYYRQITANRMMRALLDQVRAELRKALQAQKDEMGFNLAALRFIGKKQEEIGRGDYVDEEIWDDDVGSKTKKKRTFVDVA